MVLGETIFLLPFVLTRIFRPTFLSVFEVNNFQLGSAFSVYGLVAMGSYFLGGPIADRFKSRQLIIGSLILTAIGGLYLTSIPGTMGLTIVYGFWGLTSILLFWAAFVKATRAFGGDSQGLAFGSVDAGRGLFAAILSSASVFIFSSFIPEGQMENPESMTAALTNVIFLFTACTVLMCIPVWLLLPEASNSESGSKFSFVQFKELFRKRTIWLQATIVLCAYVGYKCTDFFSLYAKDVLFFNDVDAAHIGTISFWTRPIAALAAGFLGDRHQISKIIKWCFVIVIIGSLMIACGWFKSFAPFYIMIPIATTSAGIYGLRGLYFALFHEAKLPLVLTGTAVGIVSTIGYAPDIFMGPISGWIVDSFPGELGFQYLFGLLAAFSAIGLIATFLFKQSSARH